MKTLLSAAVLALLLPLAACAEAKFEQGKHYEIIAETTSAKPEVKEYFSFYCGGCNAFEPIAQSVAKKLPDDVEFKKVHVDFIRAAAPEIQNALARAYLVAKNLGKGDQVASAIFNQIHRARAPFSNENDIRNLVLIHDIDGETYDKAMKSFSVRGAANQMKKEQDELSERRVLTGVPMLIVNGKYRIINEALDRRNMETELQQLISYLLEKDA
ncbi:MAG: thiol:disulfide interchange protein DsbA/DsbL [Gammaproteobacteria bacterium]|nr:thiol:disulfide interchange protein DsbA/DsbL [Gammaproteobacteria bacterium]MBU1555214.1 thiol:disulfide interchange protein DsbA/DsbL [Gammaproteobacteria bacterium]MBU2071746.1 thiol:disulfide interchange protein DsbA/DsbL [Gammaproteobacteria bacterium]MBU2181492.1 thiol:disulfide interchange protein DsbA/DsbL [Gammaproteobacteria bacterium]MBU2203528.1 thiol:disulfide interchange protein DsbA/DsbL [Gammaproteobacteria bacterium]